MIVAHNLTAINAQRQFNIVGDKKKKSTEKLSSGYRINRAADDALAEVHSILHRVNELSVQAANDTNTDEDRKAIQAEVEQILGEIDRIADTTEFNTVKLFDGKFAIPNQVYLYDSVDEENDAIFNALKSGSIPIIPSGGITTQDGTNISSQAATEMLKMLSCSSMMYDVCENGYNMSNNKDTLQNYWNQMNDYCASLGTNAYNQAKYATEMNNAKNATSNYFADPSSANKNTLSWDYAHAINACASGGTATLTGKQHIPDRALTAMMYVTNGDYSAAEAEFKNAAYYVAIHNGFRDSKVGDILSADSYSYHKASRKEVICDVYREMFGSNAKPEQAELDKMFHGCWIQSGALSGDGINVYIDKMNKTYLGVELVNVESGDNAQKSISMIQAAIQKVSENRSRLGAQQNRLEHTYDNVSNISENTQAAESRLRDTNMAKEMVQYSLQNILQQAGISMMSQANQQQQGILTLLHI